MLMLRSLVCVSTLVLVGACGGGGSDSDASAGTTGSGGGSTSTGGSQGESVTIAFAARVNGDAFACTKTFEALGISATQARLSDFRLYVHDVRLVDGGTEIPLSLEQDGVWQFDNLALLDFEDKAGTCANGTAPTNVTVRGTVPAGTKHDAIRFKLGVPFALNHSDAATAPSPLNLSALFWNWQGGHKFLRIDAMAVNAVKPFNLHLASTGCDGDPSSGGVTSCSNPNVAEIALEGFSAAASSIVVDYGAIVSGSDLSAPDGGGAPGCLSGRTDPECGPIFQRLGLDLASGAPKPDTQVLFSVD